MVATAARLLASFTAAPPCSCERRVTARHDWCEGVVVSPLLVPAARSSDAFPATSTSVRAFFGRGQKSAAGPLLVSPAALLSHSDAGASLYAMRCRRLNLLRYSQNLPAGCRAVAGSNPVSPMSRAPVIRGFRRSRSCDDPTSQSERRPRASLPRSSSVRSATRAWCVAWSGARWMTTAGGSCRDAASARCGPRSWSPTPKPRGTTSSWTAADGHEPRSAASGRRAHGG
jgi:hypothetical protein